MTTQTGQLRAASRPTPRALKSGQNGGSARGYPAGLASLAAWSEPSARSARLHVYAARRPRMNIRICRRTGISPEHCATASCIASGSQSCPNGHNISLVFSDLAIQVIDPGCAPYVVPDDRPYAKTDDGWCELQPDGRQRWREDAIQ
jgi:hypothetical protein